MQSEFAAHSSRGGGGAGRAGPQERTVTGREPGRGTAGKPV